MVTKEEIETISAQINWIAKDSEEFFREFNERLTLLEIRYGIKAGFDPNQPRVPAGNPNGGQWTSTGGGAGGGSGSGDSSDGGLFGDLFDLFDGGGTSTETPKHPDAIEEVPTEAITLGIYGIGGGLRSIVGAIFGEFGTNILNSATEGSIENLSLTQAGNLTRFEKNLPKNANSTKIFNLSDGSKVFQADVPANNIPGSFARYEKIVDSFGNTVKYTKTTYAPDGSIVHIKVKF